MTRILLALAFLFPFVVYSQPYPSKPVRLIVTYPAGGGADTMARLLAPRLGDALGQPILVENRGGASGTIAADLVAKSAPDGHTLMLDATNHAVNPSLLAKLPYDPDKAFAPVTLLALFRAVGNPAGNRAREQHQARIGAPRPSSTQRRNRRAAGTGA